MEFKEFIDELEKNREENDNTERLAEAFAEFSCSEYEGEITSYPECYDAALEMAELKDKAIKQFFIEHMVPEEAVELNEDGQPLAESYIAVQMKRIKMGEEMFNIYKLFEKRFV